jgi:hypothetical protein
MSVREILPIILFAALMTTNATTNALAQQPSTAYPPQGALAQGALAQGATERPQAPLGHRQPKMRDLPPDVAHKEQSGQPAEGGSEQTSGQQNRKDQSPIDNEGLRICRGC